MVAGGLTHIDGVECYRIDGVERMEPFLVSVVSATDLWMFASSRGTLTAGRTDADHALLPYETDDRLHRAVGVTGPITIVARQRDGERQLWRPFSAEPTDDVTRALAKAVTGDRLVMEETNSAWGMTYRATWVPSPGYGWVRHVELENHGDTVDVEVLDGLLDVMPPGVDAVSEQLLSNLVDAYKRTETGSWGSAALYTLEALVTDRAEPAESLAATIVWSAGGVFQEVHIDERVVPAMIAGRPWEPSALLTGRRGAYLLRGVTTIESGQSSTWSLVADVALDHAQAVDRLETSTADGAAEAVAADVEAGAARLQELLHGADGHQETGDPIADAHHLSNVLFNVMRGGLFPHGGHVPVEGLLDHIRSWNRDVYLRHQTELRALGESIDVDSLRQMATDVGDPHLVRLVLEYLPLAFSRRHGDPSRPWNRFYISTGGDGAGEVLGYEGNWRDIFQNWEALLLSNPRYLPNAVAKFVNASTVDGHNPYRISHEGIDWEVPDPDDPWSNIGYWGDHQIVYLHRLVALWERFDPEGAAAWLDDPVFVYADVPYTLANHASMVRDPRNTIDYDEDRAARVEARVARLGADGKLVVDAKGGIVRVGLLEKLLVPLLAKLTAFVPGGGIWMNTQRPEWNDANNALAGYGLSMVTLYHLYAYAGWLQDVMKRHDGSARSFSASAAEWMRGIADVLERSLETDAAGDDHDRRTMMDALGAVGARYRRAAAREFDPTPVQVEATDIERLLSAALVHLERTVDCALRPEGLYDAYNLVSFPSAEEARVHPLGPMLEGQVAALSRGTLDVAGTLAVVDALYESELYREDQHSFMLYPVRELPSFLDRNVIPPEAAADMPFLDALVGTSGILVRDANGGLHFGPRMVNESALVAALERCGADPDESRQVAALYERVFGHHGYTGRSGSMHGYEGIGSVYWHMVGKLLVAVQERYRSASETATESLDRLAAAYRKIRAGLGFCKDPATYGAIPTDCYSHTPAHAGAKQPGMTGQVKEEIITRFGELGLRVDEGKISLVDPLLEPAQLFGQDRSGRAYRFSYCGVPVDVVAGSEATVRVSRAGTWEPPTPGRTLDAATSASIFRRDGSIDGVEFSLPTLGTDD